MKVANAAPVAQRIGVAVVKHGDFNSKFYRIPGLDRARAAARYTAPGRSVPLKPQMALGVNGSMSKVSLP